MTSMDRIFTGLHNRFLIAFAILTLLASVPGSARAVDTVKLSVASNSSYYGPYFIAIEKGYFKEEGINVELMRAPGAAATAALLSGDVSFSTSGAAAMSAAMKGAPVKLVFSPWSRPTFQVWSTQPGIKTLSDLKGKTVGVQSRGDTFEIALRMALIANGIDPSSISYTALGLGNGRFATLASGSLPAAMVSRLDVPQLREMGALAKGHMVFDMYDNNIRIATTSLAVGDALLKNDPERVKHVVRAVVKGFRYFVANKEQSLDIIMKYNVGNGRGRKAVEEDYDDVFASRSEDGTVSRTDRQAEIDARGQIMAVAKDKLPSIEKIFDYSMAEQINKELDADGWKPAP
jgi:NitT/TauT family transport system substrate-binding protein